EDDLGLCLFRGDGEDLPAHLRIADKRQERDAGRKFCLAVLAGNPHETAAITPRAVSPLPAKQRPDDVVFLPVLEDERTPRPFAFSKDQMVREERCRLVGGALVIPELTLTPELTVPVCVRIVPERGRTLW